MTRPSGPIEPGDEAAAASGTKKPSRRTLVLLVAPIVAVSIVGTIGNAIHPKLLTEHPLALVAMEPRNRYLLLVAEKGVDFWPFLVVATIRRLVSDPLFYLLGKLYGDAGVRWIERRMGEGGGLLRGIERWFGRAAPVMVFLLPGAIVCVLAGATGMSVPLFLALNLAGTVTVVTLLYHGADLVSAPLNAINGFYADNSRTLTIVSIVVTVLWLVGQRRSGKGEVAVLTSIDELDSAPDPDADPDPGPPAPERDAT